MSKENFISYYERGEQDIAFNQITIDIEDRANRQYRPQTVHKIFDINQNNPTTLNVSIDNGRYFVLTSQINVSENGMYQKISEGDNNKITINEDTFFLDVNQEFKRAVYINKTDNCFVVKFNKVLCGTSFQSTVDEEKNIFNIPVPHSRPMSVNTNIIGYSTNNNNLFQGNYKSLFYNTEGTSIIKLQNFSEITLRSVPSTFNLPTINYGTSMGVSGGIITINTNNNITIDWFVKTQLLF